MNVHVPQARNQKLADGIDDLRTRREVAPAGSPNSRNAVVSDDYIESRATLCAPMVPRDRKAAAVLIGFAYRFVWLGES